MNQKLYTKESLTDELIKIAGMGWIKNTRGQNAGAVGNVLEDLLGIEENNLPIPNAAEWELKAQRTNTTSLTTLFHSEPSPTAVRFVPQVLLPLYGWRHEKAGLKYPNNEKSFRQTIHGCSPSDRGFMVTMDTERVQISFDYRRVSDRHQDWLLQVENNAGLNDLNPQPYWGFSDLEHTAGTKLHNCFYVQADMKRENGWEYFRYCRIQRLRGFDFNHFLEGIRTGNVLVDFDARTGHNHGTKFRLRRSFLPSLYGEALIIL
jgi:hypothetical protein